MLFKNSKNLDCACNFHANEEVENSCFLQYNVKSQTCFMPTEIKIYLNANYMRLVLYDWSKPQTERTFRSTTHVVIGQSKLKFLQ